MFHHLIYLIIRNNLNLNITFIVFKHFYLFGKKLNWYISFTDIDYYLNLINKYLVKYQLLVGNIQLIDRIHIYLTKLIILQYHSNLCLIYFFQKTKLFVIDKIQKNFYYLDSPIAYHHNPNLFYDFKKDNNLNQDIFIINFNYFVNFPI